LQCLLVQGYWVKASWGFPKGKVNQDELPVDCAIREVLFMTHLTAETFSIFGRFLVDLN
jgi:ADP-ribose pyrophosphatase YjhB (NUDIX family)